MSGVSNINQFDPEVLDALHEAIGDSINKIISIYVDDFPNSMEKMRQSLINKDIETVGRLAHSLKSSSGNLGATEIVSLALSLEMMIKNGVIASEQINRAIDQLDHAFVQVKPRLIGYIR